MFELFSKIPENFFSILTGKLKTVHIDLLYIVYQQYKKTIYVTDREVIVDAFCDYLEINNFEFDDEEDIDSTDVRGRAYYYISKFCNHGWLIQEQYADWSYKLSIPDYAIRIMDTFEKIVNGYQMEFRGQLLSIYQNLNGTEGESYLAIQQAYETTVELTNGLKELNHNIKRYTEKMLDASDIKDLLYNVFDIYQEKILGTHYYRLKTSDHISKYKNKILRLVNDIEFNRVLIQQQANLMVQDNVADSVMQGENMLYQWLETIDNAMINFQEIINEIDSRNQKYLRAAYQRVNMLYQETGNLSSKLINVLKYLSEQIKNLGDRTEIEDEFLDNIKLFKQEMLDSKSSYTIGISKGKVKPAPLSVTKIDEQVVKGKLETMKRRIQEIKTVEQMNRFVRDKIGTKKQASFSEFPLESKEDWLNLIYITIRSTSKKSEYRITKVNGKTKFVKVEKGKIPNMVIKLKEGER